jgi:hypothetical protein
MSAFDLGCVKTYRRDFVWSEKIILIAFQFFAFLHSLDPQRTLAAYCPLPVEVSREWPETGATRQELP